MGENNPGEYKVEFPCGSEEKRLSDRVDTEGQEWGVV